MGALDEMNGRDPELSARHFHPNSGLLKPTSVPKANTDLLSSPSTAKLPHCQWATAWAISKVPQINAAKLMSSAGQGAWIPQGKLLARPCREGEGGTGALWQPEWNMVTPLFQLWNHKIISGRKAL